MSDRASRNHGVNNTFTFLSKDNLTQRIVPAKADSPTYSYKHDGLQKVVYGKAS